jgi:hypothetical protein
VNLLAEIVLLAVAALAVAICVALLPAPRPLRRRRAVTHGAPRPDQLAAIERLVTTAGTSATHTHAYLRPLLIQIAAHRLVARGQTLDRMPSAIGQELFGDRLWDLVRPDRPFPEDRHGPGVPLQELGEMLEVLERL